MSALLMAWRPRSFAEAMLRGALLAPIRTKGKAGVLLDLG